MVDLIRDASAFVLSICRRASAFLLALVRDNRRTAAVSGALVTMLVAFGLNEHKVAMIVGGVSAFVASLFASQSDTNRALQRIEEEDSEPNT